MFVHLQKKKALIAKKYDWKLLIDDQWENIFEILDATDEEKLESKDILIPRYGWNDFESNEELRLKYLEKINHYLEKGCTFNYSEFFNKDFYSQ